MRTSTLDLLRQAQRDGYAVPAFNIVDDVSLFEGAAAVLSDLGEPYAPLSILADPRAIRFGGLATLERVLSHSS